MLSFLKVSRGTFGNLQGYRTIKEHQYRSKHQWNGLNVNRSPRHLVKVMLLGISLVACSALVLFTSSLTSMSDLRTRLVDEGSGLLCELGRHSIQDFNQPFFPAYRWYVGLSTGKSRELSKTDFVAMGLRRPRVSLHSMFGVRQDLILFQNIGGPGIAANIAMQPVISDGKIMEFELNQENYSLRSTGGGENFRIEWLPTPKGTADREPTKLLMHAFVSETTERLISFSSRGGLALVAILCTLLTYSSAMDYYSSARPYIDWLWFVKFLLIYSLPIFVGVFCCSIWRSTFLSGVPFATSTRLRGRLVLCSIFVFVAASVILTAFFQYRFLHRGVSGWSGVSELDLCVWFSVGFVFVFSVLLYRTLPSARISGVKLGRPTTKMF